MLWFINCYFKVIIFPIIQFLWIWPFFIWTHWIFMEKAMAPHSSTLAWKIPWMEEPGRLQSMGSQRVGHNWATSLSLFTFMHWRRKWQPTPVFLPGESQGRGSLVGCRLWGYRVGQDWSDLNIQDCNTYICIYVHICIFTTFNCGKLYHNSDLKPTHNCITILT